MATKLGKFSLCEGQLETIQKPVNVHFNPAGNKVLSEQVTKVIKEAVATAQAK